jgi:hypothetical protein
MNSSRAHSEMAQLSCVGSDWEMIFWAAHATPGIKVQLALRVSAAAMWERAVQVDVEEDNGVPTRVVIMSVQFEDAAVQVKVFCGRCGSLWSGMCPRDWPWAGWRRN